MASIVRISLLAPAFALLAGCAVHHARHGPDSMAHCRAAQRYEGLHVYCSRRVSRAALVVLPVEDGALEIWERSRETMYWRPFAGDVIAVIGTDERSSFTWTDDKDLWVTGLEGDALWRRAMRNVNALARTAQIFDEGDGTFIVDSDDVSANMLIFADRLWRRSEFRDFRGPPAVALLGRGWFRVGDSADATAIDRLESATAGDHCTYRSDYPSFCSRAGHVFVRAAQGSWRIAEPPASAGAAADAEPRNRGRLEGDGARPRRVSPRATR